MRNATSLITHLVATLPLPPAANALYEMILAGNGLFLRGHRNQLEVLFPIATHEIEGLPYLETQITPLVPRIPATLLTDMLRDARAYWNSPDGHRQPQITFRVGLYGHFYPIPASLIADLPPDLQDTYLLNQHTRAYAE
ncbi:MAG: hypothetical protein NTZ28_02515 [Nitrospirae bacterium]|nr:hypothetical protein [Nitrospirota bacterium]